MAYHWIYNKEKPSTFEPEAALVFNLAMVMYYVQNPVFEGTVTADMKALASKFWKNELKDKDYRWTWVALVNAHIQGKDKEEDIPKLLANKYSSGEGNYDDWLHLYAGALDSERPFTLRAMKIWMRGLLADLRLEETR